MAKLTAEEKAKKKKEEKRLKEGRKMAEKRAKQEAKLDKIREKEERKAEKARIKENKRRAKKGLPPIEETKPAPQGPVAPINVEQEPVEETVKKEEVVDESAPSPEQKQEEAKEEEKTTEKKERPINYHISLREDGKWQVKKAKGERAIKLFSTQAEAIAFAKERAERMDASVTIHKKDGKIRKQNYNK